MIFKCIILCFIGFQFDQSLVEKRIERADQLIDSLMYDKAINLLQDLLLDPDTRLQDSMKIKVYFRIGSSYLDLEKNEIGINYYTKALEMALELGDRKHIALARYGIAVGHQQEANYNTAQNLYSKAIKYLKEEGDSLTLSYIYSNLSFLFYKIDRLDSMMYYSRKALSIQLDLGDKYGSGASYSNLGLISEENKDYDKAIYYYKASLKDYQDVNWITGVSTSLRYIGINYYLNGQIDSAASYLYKYDSLGHDIFHQDYQD